MVAARVRRVEDQGLALTGPGGLLKSLTKKVKETAPEEELGEHLSYDKQDPVCRNLGKLAHGYRPKMVVTDARCDLELAVPRDREGSWSSGAGPLGDPDLVDQRTGGEFMPFLWPRLCGDPRSEFDRTPAL